MSTYSYYLQIIWLKHATTMMCEPVLTDLLSCLESMTVGTALSGDAKSSVIDPGGADVAAVVVAVVVVAVALGAHLDVPECRCVQARDLAPVYSELTWDKGCSSCEPWIIGGYRGYRFYRVV